MQTRAMSIQLQGRVIILARQINPLAFESYIKAEEMGA